MIARTLLLAAVTLASVGFPMARSLAQIPVPKPGPILELRQYKIVHGRRDAFVDLFEKEFVETQDAVGMHLLGQFRDMNDPNRFTWMRSFPTMADRMQSLAEFYTGPVWHAHRNTANPMLDDNDNVLLLKPATADSGFAAPPPRPAPGRQTEANSVIVAHIHYLWKDPAEGFTTFFVNRIAPNLEAAGLPVLGAYVTEKTENSFPRLPVRQSEKVFVWFTRAPTKIRFRRAWQKAIASSAWQQHVTPELPDFEERSAQTLFLQPTPRSALR